MASFLTDLLISKALTWFRELVAIDSSNPPGDEVRVVNHCAKILEAHGIKPLFVGKTEKRINLIAHHRGTSDAAPLLLSAHSDTVPAGDLSEWKYPPHSGAEAEGCIWGRGTLDMKYKIAFDCATIIAAKENRLPRPLTMVLLADEEEGGDYGVRFILEKHRDLIQGSHVLNEVGGFPIRIADGLFLPFQAGERSALHVRISAHGAAGHSALGGGINSIVLLSDAIRALTRESLGYSLSKTSIEFFSTIARRVSAPYQDVFRALLSPTHAQDALSKIPDRSLASMLQGMLFHTFTPTIFQGGSKINVIPQEASFDADLRVIPGVSCDSIVALIRERLRNELAELATHLQVEVVRFDEGYETSSDDPIFKALSSHLESDWCKTLPGLTSVAMLMPASSDNAAYARAGIRPIGFAPLKFSEKFQGFSLVHSFNERVQTSAFIEGLKGYAGAIANL